MKRNGLFSALTTIGTTALALFLLSTALSATARENARQERESMMAQLLPGSTQFVPESYRGDDPAVLGVHRGDGGYVVETVTDGYAGDVHLMVGVDPKGRVTGVVVRNMEETWGLGSQAIGDVDFLSQFLGMSGEAEVNKNIDALTGATVTTKAIIKGVNSACAFVTGADVSSGATEWEG